MGTLLKNIKTGFNSLVNKAKSCFTIGKAKAWEPKTETTRQEINVVPRFKRSTALAKNLRLYRLKRRHKNHIAAMSRRINWGIGR